MMSNHDRIVCAEHMTSCVLTGNGLARVSADSGFVDFLSNEKVPLAWHTWFGQKHLVGLLRYLLRCHPWESSCEDRCEGLISAAALSALGEVLLSEI